MPKVTGLYHIGVTGSRDGASAAQADETFFYLKSIVVFRWATRGQRCVLHHGDCIGFDAIAAEMGRVLGMLLVSHPPKPEEFRAHFPSDVECEPQSYYARDRALVDAVSELVAAPRRARHVSGTWYTIDYAKSRDCPTLVIPRVGTMRCQNA